MKFLDFTHQKNWNLSSPLWKTLLPRMDSPDHSTTTSHTVSKFINLKVVHCSPPQPKSWSFLPVHFPFVGSLLKDFFVTASQLPLLSNPVTICVGIQQNLHIVLIMDCSNSKFTINCESNPAFYRKCSVQWMEGWSESSMMKVSDGGKDKQF